ncbi:hypothetical protein [Caldibacillus debilis]|uniref:Uncharacterized protein n=1 Tax=Caldibacillus debilis TaxID=301148 RepID=A0A150LKN7_9BACI|nr:hypothetical protein [Caldibacillus debilis]KYD12790.1 hypothetical protein B4135_0389 [Caldibacillus debilis]
MTGSPLGLFNDPASVRRENTTGELLLVTVVNGLSVDTLLLLAGLFAGKKYPLWLRSWFVIHSVLILAGAAKAWRLPYLFGADEKRLQRNQAMFGGTHSFLPEKTASRSTPSTPPSTRSFCSACSWPSIFLSRK